MEKEDKSSSKSPENALGCSSRCSELWYQKFLLMSKHERV